MRKAYWNGELIAESDGTVVMDGRHYFPPDSVRRECLQASQTRTTDPEKGEATFFHLVVNGRLNADAAWTYRDPTPSARHIKNHIAFWHGVEIE